MYLLISIYSFVLFYCVQEFDQQAARKVRRMFEEIDSMLYEVMKPVNAGSSLQNECKEWKNSFPHLR